MKPEIIADYACTTGEGPLWHPLEKKLYWVDIPAGCMFWYDPLSKEHKQCYQGEMIGGFTVQPDGALLLFMEKGSIKLWRNGGFTTIIDSIPDELESRFNDVIADPVGRVFCGTMATKSRLGRLYRLDPDGKISKLLEGIGCSNGMGFTPDNKQMYYTDSRKREIYLFDYNRDTGAITDQRVFIRIPEGEGVLDGMTVDAEGYVWSARWNGSCLVRYATDGKEDLRIEFPAKKISSITFGGEDYTDIYVTSAGGDKKEKEGKGAGALFGLNLGIKGVPEFFSKICVYHT